MSLIPSSRNQTHMSSIALGANETSTIDRPISDQLIPPAPSPSRRIALAILILGTAVALSYASIAGWLYPSLSVDNSGIQSFSVGRATVTIGFINPGHRSIQVDQVVISSGGGEMQEATVTRWSDSVPSEATAAEDAFPIVIGPSDRVTISFDVIPTDCESGSAPIDAFADVSFRFAGGVPSVSRSQRLNDLVQGSMACEQ